MFFTRIFKSDRRRQNRQLWNSSVRVLTESACLDAIGINLSEHGMCLFAMANLALGSQIQIEFRTPRSTELVRVFGVVRYRALYLYGVEFLADSHQDAGTQEDLVNATRNYGFLCLGLGSSFGNWLVSATS